MLNTPIRKSTSENLRKINPLLLPLPWLAVLILVVIFIAMKYSSTSEEAIASATNTKVFPQLFMTSVEMREFDKNGAIHYQLNTPLVRHFQVSDKATAQDYTLIDTPQVVFSQTPQKSAWNVSADQGRSDDNGTWITLINHIVALQHSETQGDISLNTNELHLNTQKQFAETDKAVTMRSAKSLVEARGMRADMKSDRIELLSHVKGTYEP